MSHRNFAVPEGASAQVSYGDSRCTEPHESGLQSRNTEERQVLSTPSVVSESRLSVGHGPFEHGYVAGHGPPTGVAGTSVPTTVTTTVSTASVCVTSTNHTRLVSTVATPRVASFEANYQAAANQGFMYSVPWLPEGYAIYNPTEPAAAATQAAESSRTTFVQSTGPWHPPPTADTAIPSTSSSRGPSSNSDQTEQLIRRICAALESRSNVITPPVASGSATPRADQGQQFVPGTPASTSVSTAPSQVRGHPASSPSYDQYFSDVSDPDQEEKLEDLEPSEDSNDESEAKVLSRDRLPNCTPAVIHRVADSLNLKIDSDDEQDANVPDLDLGIRLFAKQLHRNPCPLPQTVSKLWEESGKRKHYIGKFATRDFSRSLPCSKKDYERFLKSPVLDEDVKVHLPKSSTRHFSQHWEQELLLLDKAVSSSTRLGSFAMLVAHDLLQAIKDPDRASEALEDANVLAAITANQTSLSMMVARRITFLRRDNVSSSIRKDLNADVVDRLSKSKSSTRENLLGGAFNAAVLAAAEKVEGEKSIRQARTKFSQRSNKRTNNAKRKASSSPPRQPKAKPQPPSSKPATTSRRPESSSSSRGRRDSRTSDYRSPRSSRPRSRSSPVKKGRGRQSRS